MLRILTNWKLYAFPWMFLALACGRADDPQTEQKTAELKKKAGFPGKILLEALEDVDLRDDQRAEVTRLMEETRTLLAPMRDARANLMRDAAAAIRAGAVDEKTVKTRMESMRAQFEQVKPGIIKNLNRLHTLLDQPQRRQLVDALHKRHKSKMHGKFGPGKGGPGRFLKHMAAKFGLTSRQEDNIRARLKEEFPHHPRHARKHMRGIRNKMHAAAEAFVADGFDAAKLEIWEHRHGKHKLDKIIGASRIVLPMLDTAQRDRIARHLEDKAAKFDH